MISKIVTALCILLGISVSFGQDFSPQSAMSDSFSDYAYSSSFPFEIFLAARWERNSLSNCTANASVNVNYNIPNGKLEISPIPNTSGVNVNGLKSKRKMNFQDSYIQVEALPLSSDSVTEFAVGTDCNNWYRVYRKGSNLEFQSKNGGVITTIASIPYSLSLHSYWRIRHNPADGKIIYETAEIETNSAVDPTNPTILKEKRLNWTQQGETTVNFSLAEVRFEIVGGTDSSVSNPGLVVFDNFLFDSNSPEVIPPRRTVDTSYPLLDGIVRSVTNCQEFQSTLNDAEPGDTVSIAPSLVCEGKFTLPVKSNPNNKWIVVRSASSELDAEGSLRPGRRVNGENPSHLQQMPKILVNNVFDAGLHLQEGANYYRIVGINVGIKPSFSTGNAHIGSLVYMKPSANQVNHVVIDRCYIHGEIDLNKKLKRAVDLHGSYLAVIDSEISKVLHTGLQQGQAISSYSGTGPIKIDNNSLEALAQNILLGGAATATPSESLTDIVISRNYFFKRDALYQTWGCNPSLPDVCTGLPPVNGIEIKQGRRVQIIGNVFDQTRDGIYVKNTGDNVCSKCLTEHINVENNKFINVRKPFLVHTGESDLGSGEDYFPQSPNHITVKNALSFFTEETNSYIKGWLTSEGIHGRDDVTDFRIIHTTQETYKNFFTHFNPPNLFNFDYRDNVVEFNKLQISADGTPTLNTALFPYKWRKNIIVNNSDKPGGSQLSDNQLKQSYPCYVFNAFCTEIGTYVVSSWNSAESTGDQVGFVENSQAIRRNTGNYRLTSNSPYKNNGTDNTDIGVNQDVLDSAISGAVTGVWEQAQTPYPGSNPLNVPLTLEAEDFNNGGQNVAYNEVFGSTRSSAYRSSPVEEVDIQARSTASNGYVVFEAAAGEWMKYTVNVPVTRKYDIGVRYASEFNNGKFHVEIDGVNVTGQMTVASTGGWGTYRNLTKRGVMITAGTHVVRLALDENSPDGCGCIVANFDAIRFTSTLFDFDDDGRADISLFRPSANNWYLNRSSAGFTAVALGASTDIIAPGDFDGDGKTDVSVFRPSNGTWYRYNSSNGNIFAVSFGANGDIPVQADYDGDGKADTAVWRPSDRGWYYLKSSNGSFSGSIFGDSGDKPAVGDFDGDGKSDLAVFRPSTGHWSILNSSNASVTGVLFGAASDNIVPADYDGDGKTDVAVFRPSQGTWHLQRSLLGPTSVAFGQSGDIPVPADYDGDGKADIGVFRPSTRNWYLLRSTEGITAQMFGESGDVPIPSTYVR